MQVISQPSPNFNSRDGHAVDMLVLHYTGMKSGANALDRMCDPTAEVSAHYMVEEDGRIFQLVDEGMRAWHAGKSFWRGNNNINQRSIGIEMVNPGHEYGYRPFPEVQMQSVIWLCKAILSRHAIPARNVVGHSDVAPARKEDPGELFDWKRLAEQGIGLFPSSFGTTFANAKDVSAGSQANGERFCADTDLSRKMTIYGYDTTNLPAAITAFQRHFCPHLLDGVCEEECEEKLGYLMGELEP